MAIAEKQPQMFPEKDLLPHHDHSHNPYKDEISSSSTRGISLRNLKPALLLLELRAKETENVTHLNKKSVWNFIRFDFITSIY
ncbi:hypothetical protein [Sphingobacterium faecium]|uniref:hypothetical protein n=1 Tax=Sphingobacterium faecium TaxID=34087 RepID=UPI00320B84CA